MPAFNWTDIAVIVVIGVFTIIGLKNGFLYSVFRLLSYVIALVVAVKAYPILSSALQKTIIYDKIKVSVINSIQGGNTAAAISGNGLQMSQAAVQNIKLPDFLKTTIVNDVTQKGLETKAAIVDAIASEVSMLIINIISMLLIYILIRFGLIFARIIIKAISSLPIFKQLDRAGGVALGAVEGILVVYILCAFITLFSTSPAFNSTINSVKQASFAHYFYENNFIVSWLTPDEQLNSTSTHQTNPINSTSSQKSSNP